MLRPAKISDVDALRAIERAAGEQFRALGMHSVADDEPPTTPVLRHFIDAGHAWIVKRDEGLLHR